MTRLLLTMFALFCVSKRNLQLSRISIDITSLLEHFTGGKTDASRDLRVQFGDYVLATAATQTTPCVAGLKNALTATAVLILQAVPRFGAWLRTLLSPHTNLMHTYIMCLVEFQSYERGTLAMTPEICS